MDYAWVSGVVVLVILVILILGWLPRRTADSMKRVVEHREDKYSPSLHLVDADSGTRFSDERKPSAKGIVMQSERKNIAASSSEASVARPAKAMKERARVAHIRRLRREAARRRAIVSATLLVVTIVVFAISFPLKFNPIFALIPAVLLALVVALGVRTANHARAWERNLKIRRGANARARQARRNRSLASADGHNASSNTQVASKNPATVVSGDEQPTGLMAEQEIRKAVKQTRAEKERIGHRRVQPSVKAKTAAASKGADGRNDESASRQAVSSTEAEVRSRNVVKRSASRSDSKSRSVSHSQSRLHPVPTPTSKTQVRSASKVADGAEKKSFKPSDIRDRNAPAHASDKVNAVASRQQGEPNDATNELKQVHPAQALDVVDLAPNQDLISFSLGAPRNGVEIKSEEPKSLEIKSTRQVAKAKADAKNIEVTSSATSKHSGKAAGQTAKKSRKDSGSSVSNAAETGTRANRAEGSMSALISKKSRRRVRAAAKRACATAERDGRASNKKATYTSDPEKFHASEVSADTEAPAVSSDSLGTGLEKILERRQV